MSRISALLLLVLATFLGQTKSQHNPNFASGRTVITHLFEWRWNDIAEECERFLGPYGYAGVQVSPPSENVIVHNSNNQRPWWERYQPVSYKLDSTRSGNEEEFISMVARCNAVGVHIYVDAVINHMTGGGQSGVGTGGSPFDANALSFPGVPYSALDFNSNGACPDRCPTDGSIDDYGDACQVRNCRLVGLTDLNHKVTWVQDKIVEFMNKLISYGVAGFRVDAMKHMWPGELERIFNRLDNLPTSHGFPAGSRPFIAQEVIDLGNEAIGVGEYTHLGRVTEFKYSAKIGNVFRGHDELQHLHNWGQGWGFVEDGNALVFVDNHDNQRGHGAGGADILTFRQARQYKMATAFGLSWPYGVSRVMSSFFWEQDFDGNGNDRNDWVGPPHDGNYNTLPVTINPNLTCGNGWICEHRWRQIYNMVKFRNVAQGSAVTNWWTNGKNQIAFSRQGRAFIALNNDDHDLSQMLQTSLPAGTYCDIISGNLENGSCTGNTITVGSDGRAFIFASNTDPDPFVAIHIDAKQS